MLKTCNGTLPTITRDRLDLLPPPTPRTAEAQIMIFPRNHSLSADTQEDEEEEQSTFILIYSLGTRQQLNINSMSSSPRLHLIAISPQSSAAVST